MRTLRTSPKMRLSTDEQGQTVSEYSLLLAFIFLVSFCLFLSSAGNITSIWETANNLISHGTPAQQSGKQ
jgi:Flp pilus assembly pilin Flp